MRQVVQEVLKGNKTIVSKSVKDLTHSSKERSNVDSSLKQINRPNYQQLRKGRRLAYELQSPNPSNRLNTNNEKSTHQLSSVTSVPKQYNTHSLSKLSSMSLVQGNMPKKNNSYVSTKKHKGKSRVIGKTKNGGCVWFFPHLPSHLLGNFHRPLDDAAVGVIKMPNCLPSYLLLINETIRNNQDIKFYSSWHHDGKTPFLVELYDVHVERLEKIMTDMFQKINRRSLKKHDIYTVPSPSSWLSKQLKLSSSTDAIAFLEGISYYTSIVLLDVLQENFHMEDIDYEINSNYLLLKGNYHFISKLVTELKKEADLMINADVLI